MTLTAKVLGYVSRSVVSVSTKLSAAAVLGLATLPLLPHDAASLMGTPASQPPAAPIELIHARPVPLIEDAPVDPAFELVARRSRVKREGPPEASDPAHKISAISPPAPEPEKAAVPAPETKPEAAQTEPPKPDTWSDAQVIAALRECVKLLAPIAADIEIAEPVKREQCGAPAPVMLRRIGSGANKVEISPPAMLNCAMVVSLHAWVEKTLQPAAQEVFGSPIARLRSASGYVCRNRVGSSAHSDRLSEHALANAVDIAGFVTADGRTVDVARFWGPTARDEREAQKVAAAKPKDAGAAAEKSIPAKIERVSDRRMSAIAHSADEPSKGRKKNAPAQAAELQKSGKAASDTSTDPRAIPATRVAGGEDIRASVEARFLRRLHKGACGVFGTVLGPEANEAHRDHFHFDLAHRRNSAFCQ